MIYKGGDTKGADPVSFQKRVKPGGIGAEVPIVGFRGP